MYKPMLSPNEDPMSYPNYFSELRFPLLCSPKLDGIRCTVINGHCLSRTLKDLPSIHVQREFGHLDGLDGEIIVGSPRDEDVYNRTQSHVMSQDKPHPDFRFYAFDTNFVSLSKVPFKERLEIARDIILEHNAREENKQVMLVEHHLVHTLDELWKYEEMILQFGYEGIMMRDPEGIYKHGRGTFKQGLIYKLKRFADDEGVVVDFIEGTNNNNTKETDERGYSKRSTAKEGLTASGLLGTFIVDFNGEHVNVAPGKFNHDERKYIWEHKEAYIGELLKFRHFPRGVKEKPRFPRAIGFRDRMDT